MHKLAIKRDNFGWFSSFENCYTIKYYFIIAHLILVLMFMSTSHIVVFLYARIISLLPLLLLLLLWQIKWAKYTHNHHMYNTCGVSCKAAFTFLITLQAICLRFKVCECQLYCICHRNKNKKHWNSVALSLSLSLLMFAGDICQVA